MPFQEVSHRRSLSTQRLFNFFSTFSAISAMNSYVSYSIRLEAFQVSGRAEMKKIINTLAESGLRNPSLNEFEKKDQ